MRARLEALVLALLFTTACTPETAGAPPANPRAPDPPAMGASLSVPAGRWHVVLIAGDNNSPAFDNGVRAMRDRRQPGSKLVPVRQRFRGRAVPRCSEPEARRVGHRPRGIPSPRVRSSGRKHASRSSSRLSANGEVPARGVQRGFVVAEPGIAAQRDRWRCPWRRCADTHRHHLRPSSLLRHAAARVSGEGVGERTVRRRKRLNRRSSLGERRDS